MASDSDDADFFDKLVLDDDLHDSVSRHISTLSLASDGDHTVLGAPDLPALASAADVGSPLSGKGAHTTIKQVQWSVFGGSGGNEADPFGDFSVGGGGTGEEAFFGGCAAVNQSLESSVVGSSATEVDHSFSNRIEQSATTQLEWGGGAVDSTDPKHLVSLYPGWKYDEGTQQWYQVNSLGATGNGDGAGGLAVAESDGVQQLPSSVSYLQNSVQAGLETIVEEGSATVGRFTASSCGHDGSSTAASEFPANMLFYAEYPGWYFDTNTQQWNSLESYQQGTLQTVTSAAVSDGFLGKDHSLAQTEDSFASGYNQQGQLQQDVFSTNMKPDSLGVNSFVGSLYGSNQHAADQIGQQVNAEPFESSTNHQPSINTFVPSKSQYSGNEGNQAGYMGFEPSTGHQKGFEPSKVHLSGYKGFESSTDHQASYNRFKPSTSHDYGNVNGVAKSQDFVPTVSMYHTQTRADVSQQVLSSSYLGSNNFMNFAQQQFLGSNASSQQFGYSSHGERSSAGRPPHALVAFGFGGKLLVMKETSSMTKNFNSGNQGNFSGMVSILNISEIAADRVDHSSITNGSTLSHFHALLRQPIPGPLVGGSAAAKDVNKWLDEMITCYESSVSEFQGGNVQKLLITLLKILCQHYGKLRSPFRSDPSQEDLDGPEMAITKLFSSSKSSAHMREFGSIVHCMKNIPSESRIQVTAQEVQNLLVSGRRKEALQCAQEGQLWGPALTLALQLGDKFYVDTVKKMAHCHFVSGSPLRTLCLLIAGQPADVFSVEDPVDSNYSTLHTPQQPMESTPKGMLDDWEENLAIITANRTKGDELVITHLGDCLWKEKNEVAAAHSCYLVAELNVESYYESARLCLIGADHVKCPRTFASPEAIQRTEVYEYAKVLGNSQYILHPFQPYKLIYAHMLAEVGKVSDSLRYCQASLKVLKASGRTPELETWKQLFSSLEERLRTHQQGGYGTNLAPAKIVGKIFTSLDKSLSRMMGTPSAPLPQLPQGSVNDGDSYSAPAATKVVNSQSVMAMSSLMSSTSEQSMSDMAVNSGPGRTIAHNRSVSEPDIGRTPKQGSGSDSAQRTSGSGTTRFGWLSSTLQKTVGFVSKSHRQAKLGEQNKFYYDEKLKRWVEEGTEVPAEEPPLPPPTKATFQNGMPDYNFNGPSSGDHTPSGFAEVKPSNPSELSYGMPPMPSSQNQFSSRGRMGVRSRYVDTFNKGDANAIGVAPSYNKLAAPSIKPLSGAKLFVPGPAVVSSEQMPASTAEALSETTHQNEPSSSPPVEVSFSSPPPAVPMSSTLQRYPSMDNIITPSVSVNSSFSRSRAASWSGIYSDQFSTTADARSPDGQTTQTPLMPGRKPSHSRSSSNSSVPFSGLAEDLQDVGL